MAKIVKLIQRAMEREHRLSVIAGLTIILVGIVVVFNQSMDSIPQTADLAAQMEARLEQLETVQGTLQLVHGAAVTEQELWVERPRRLRTEIEVGPPGLAPVGTSQKTTLVLNEEEAWFYNPNLSIATVTDRTEYAPAEGLDVGGSILESMPADILVALRQATDLQILGEDEVAGRNALHVQIFLTEESSPFGGRMLNVALDRDFYYPLAVESDSGFVLTFRSIQFNRDIDPATFNFVPPAGISVNEITNSPER